MCLEAKRVTDGSLYKGKLAQADVKVLHLTPLIPYSNSGLVVMVMSTNLRMEDTDLRQS
jgi:hypothetical protein